MKNSILLFILFSVFSIIGLDNLGNILPIGIDKVLKDPKRPNKKAKRIVGSNSAFKSQVAIGECKRSNGLVSTDRSGGTIVMNMPLPGQPAITYRYGSGFNVYSPDRSRWLSWQGDGNLVLYDTASGRSVWASNTYHKGEILAFQPDNNIVIYDNQGRGVWDSGTIDYCFHNGESSPNYGATLYLFNANVGGSLLLVGQVDNINMGSNGSSGSHFRQDFYR